MNLTKFSGLTLIASDGDHHQQPLLLSDSVNTLIGPRENQILHVFMVFTHVSTALPEVYTS